MKTTTCGLVAALLVMSFGSVSLGGAGHVASVQLEALDPVSMTPLRSVHVGDRFVLVGWAHDGRPDPRGLRSVYLDIAFDGSRASPSGGFDYFGTNDWTLFRSGTIASGRLGHVGGATGESSPSEVEGVVFSVLVTAKAPGVVTFSPSLAADLPVHYTLFHGTYGSLPLVPTGAPGQNPYAPLDVNADNFVSPMDVLLHRNALTLYGCRPYEEGPPFLDVDGDRFHTLRDYQLSLNYFEDAGSGHADPNAQAFADPLTAADVSLESVTLEVLPNLPVFIFYNNSAWDDGDGSANGADDSAIATDKVALWHGMKATVANYTSYSKGINGLMIDIRDLPGTPTLTDFLFRKGNDSNPYGDDWEDPDDDWPWAPDPIAITVRAGAGQDGADRVTLIWADSVVRKCWLQVTVLATDATGLAGDEVFYVGNAVGDSGNSVTDTAVNVVDALGVRANPHTLLSPAPIDDVFDYNRDWQVNVQDELIVRANPTTLLTDLNLIDLTAYGGDGGAGR